MFTRRVVFRIRADSPAEFTRTVEDTFTTPEFSEAAEMFQISGATFHKIVADRRG